MLVPGTIDAHRADHVVLAEHHAIDVNHQQIHVIEAPLQQLFQRFFACLRRFPAHIGLRYPAGRRHLRQHFGVLPRRDPPHQHIQHPLTQPVFLHGLVGRTRHFAAALLPYPRLPHTHLPLPHPPPPPLPPAPHDFPPPPPP